MMKCLYTCKKGNVTTSSYDASVYLNRHDKQPFGSFSCALIGLRDTFHKTGLVDVSDVIADEGQILKIRCKTREDAAGETCK